MRPFRVAYAPSARRMLDSNVLVLNRSFLPIHVTPVRRACVMLYAGLARAVDADCQTFDFAAWCRRSAGRRRRVARSRRPIDADSSRHHAALLRPHSAGDMCASPGNNVYSRDRDTCQYCGRRFPPRHPTEPRSRDPGAPRAAASSWENVVCSAALRVIGARADTLPSRRACASSGGRRSRAGRRCSRTSARRFATKNGGRSCTSRRRNRGSQPEAGRGAVRRREPRSTGARRRG